MPFTQLYCTFCRECLHSNNPVTWRGDKPYHPHHADRHIPNNVTAKPDKLERRVPRFISDDMHIQ